MGGDGKVGNLNLCNPTSKGLVHAGKWFVDIWLSQKLIFVVLTMNVKSYYAYVVTCFWFT